MTPRLTHLAGAAAMFAVAAHAADLASPTYTAAQAERGATVYQQQCAGCHGNDLDNGQFAAPLKGPAFRQHWGGGPLSGPWVVMTQQMPPDNPGGLDPATYADLLAFILSKNDVAAGGPELQPDADALGHMAAPK